MRLTIDYRVFEAAPKECFIGYCPFQLLLNLIAPIVIPESLSFVGFSLRTGNVNYM